MQRLAIKPSEFSVSVIEKVQAFDNAARNFHLQTRYSPAVAIQVTPELSWTIKNDFANNEFSKNALPMELVQ